MSKQTCITVFIVMALSIIGMIGITVYKNFYIYSKDYQIYVARDSVQVYDKNKLLAVIPWGKDGIDSVVLADNDKYAQ